MAAALEVRLQALDGTWETVGVDRYPGVVADGFTAAANEWGHDTCSFVLRRPTDVQHPDLSSFTPAEVWRGGSLIFEGRVKETPTTEGPEGQIAVTGVGWQAHADDNQYERTFVQSDMTVAIDNRSLLQADLGVLRAGAHVETGVGAILVGWDNGTVMDGTGFVSCAVIDMGPDPRRWAKRVILDWEVVSGGGDAGFVFEVVGTDAATSPLESGRRAFYQPGTWAAVSGGTNVGGTASTPTRYVHFFCFYTTPATTLGGDRLIRIKRILIATDTAYESGGASVLKASTVVADALDQCCPLLSTDRSLIQATSFNLPEFALDGPHTARDVITAANAVHRWRTRIRRGKVPEFAPQPNAPLLKVGSWPGSRFQDASAGSGEEIYNRVLVTGTGPDGVALTVERYSAHQPDAHLEFDLAFPVGGGGGGAYDSPSGLDPHRPYAVTLNAVDFSAAGTIKLRFGASDGTGTLVDYVEFVVSAGGAGTVTVNQTKVWVSKVAQIPERGLQVIVTAGTPSTTTHAYVSAGTTLVDRRGFVRTKELQIGSALDEALGAQLGEVFLQTHARTPLKGSIDISPGGLRSVATDEDIHPSELLNNTTELIRLAHLTDPDTGAVGRDGIIASASYSEETETASVQLDNDRNSFEQLLQRMAVVVGSART